jgi:hypothetical protein
LQATAVRYNRNKNNTGIDFHETVMATTNAERQAAWRARQKDLGAAGRRWRIVDLTLAERDFLQQCLIQYRHHPEAAEALLRMFVEEISAGGC